MSQPIITISREFGSGGRLIGKKLALHLGIPCYDRTIIQKTSERSGLSPDFIARAEERARSRFQFHVSPVTMTGTAGHPPSHPIVHHSVPVSHQAFFAQAEVIRELADAGPCILVGRCSDYVLADHKDCIKIFIHASLEDRTRRCIEEYHVPPEEIEARIRQMDRGRRNYYHYYTGRKWGEVHRYDLALNSSITGIDGAVELISDLIEIHGHSGASL